MEPIPVHPTAAHKTFYNLMPNTTYTVDVAPVYGFEVGASTVIEVTTGNGDTNK